MIERLRSTIAHLRETQREQRRALKPFSQWRPRYSWQLSRTTVLAGCRRPKTLPAVGLSLGGPARGRCFLARTRRVSTPTAHRISTPQRHGARRQYLLLSVLEPIVGCRDDRVTTPPLVSKRSGSKPTLRSIRAELRRRRPESTEPFSASSTADTACRLVTVCLLKDRTLRPRSSRVRREGDRRHRAPAGHHPRPLHPDPAAPPEARRAHRAMA